MFLKQFIPEDGPLSLASSDQQDDIHRVLLAYYRLLRSCRSPIVDLGWNLSPLMKQTSTRGHDRGACWLAIRCYALHTGMSEAERGKLERQILGEDSVEDCPVQYGQDNEGNVIEADGWILPFLEDRRINEFRQGVCSPQDYYRDSEFSDIRISERDLR